MAATPHESMPKRCGCWADLKAAYRLLSHPKVRPEAMVAPHLNLTRERCIDQGLVLCVQDDTDLSSAKVAGDAYKQHSTLAVLPDGQVLGMLAASWFERVDAPAGETRQQREARWRESCVWPEAVTAVGAAPPGCRFVHVADRAADDLDFIERCCDQQVGFIVRARHDRRVNGGEAKLWSTLGEQPAAGSMRVDVPRQRDARTGRLRPQRKAQVQVRFASVRIEPPWNHPGAHASRSVQAVYVHEPTPPTDAAPIDWMLLTSEPVDDLAAALQIIRHYQQRWVIEEWHRAMKEGCRLEQSQLDQPADLQRLAALSSVVAVRLIQLRDLADPQREPERANDPAVLKEAVPESWRVVVAGLAGCAADELTPARFWLTIARRGGFIGRRNDGRPGWKTIWRGWYDIQMMVAGYNLAHPTPPAQSCG